MKKRILFLLTTILSLNCYSQISFEKGYYIDNANQKINCLVRNIDWKNNPTEFEYKLSENSESNKITIKTVKEFGINNVSKYIRLDVSIDRSSNKQNLLSSDKNPIFKKEVLFLKVLIEGDASLLLYKDKSLTRYFYQTTNQNFAQLIYKEYNTPENKIGTNNEFKRQLFNNLKCSDISMDDVKNIDYEKKALLKFFTKYNNCNNTEYVNFEKKVKSDLFNLNIRPGINSSSLSISNDAISSSNVDYDNELTFRIGLELEFIMGFNKNKWAIIIEPTYQYYKAEDKSITNLSNTIVDYNSLELPIGVRHYFFLNNNSKIFINGSTIYDFVLNSKVRNRLDASSSVNLAMGLGYNYNNAYSIEFRYQTNRDILTDYVSWNSDYKTISIIFGYTLF